MQNQQFSIHDADTMPTPAIPQSPRCQCKNACKFSWFPFFMIMFVILFYIMTITTILLYNLLSESTHP